MVAAWCASGVVGKCACARRSRTAFSSRKPDMVGLALGLTPRTHGRCLVRLRRCGKMRLRAAQSNCVLIPQARHGRAGAWIDPADPWSLPGAPPALWENALARGAVELRSHPASPTWSGWRLD